MIYIEEECICTYEEHSDEPYGDWSADYSYSIKGASIAKPKRYDYCEVPDITAEVGDVVYVLYIVYGSGDSFGGSSGNGQFVCAYTDAAMAEHAKRIYEKKGTESQFYIPVGKDPDGKWVYTSTYSPASGYFESFEGAYIEKCVVK